MSITVPRRTMLERTRYAVRNFRSMAKRHLTSKASHFNGRELPIASLIEVAKKYGWQTTDLGVPAAHLGWPHLSEDALAQAFPDRPTVVVIQDAFAVSVSRFFVTGDGRLLSDELWHARGDSDVGVKLFTLIRPGGSLTAMLVNHRRSITRLPPCLHAMHEHGNNYFHALVETAPRIHLARKNAQFSDLPIAVNDGMAPNIEQIFKIVAGGRPLMKLKPGLLFAFDVLAFPTDVSLIHDIYQRPRRPSDTILHIEAIREVANLVASSLDIPPPTGRQRLYLRRRGTLRHLVNEAELEDRLTAAGFEVIETGTLSLEAQISRFREAECIVAPTGAALTNIIWCKPGTRVIVLSADHIALATEVWTQLGMVSGAEVSILIGRQVQEANGIHDDFEIDVAEVERTVGSITVNSNS